MKWDLERRVDLILFAAPADFGECMFRPSVIVFLLSVLGARVCCGQTAPVKTTTTPNVSKPVAKPPDPVTHAEVEELKKQIVALTRELSDLEEDKKASDSVMYQVWADVSNLKKASAVLDPASPNEYIRIESDVGPLLVSLKNVEPYLDGYKVQLTVGNPLSLTFKGFELAATWAPRLSGTDYAGWLKKQKKKTFSLTQDLLSGRWNAVTLILSETKAEEVGYLEVSSTINTISLGVSLGN
jgi:hypothetical protein